MKISETVRLQVKQKREDENKFKVTDHTGGRWKTFVHADREEAMMFQDMNGKTSIYTSVIFNDHWRIACDYTCDHRQRTESLINVTTASAALKLTVSHVRYTRRGGY